MEAIKEIINKVVPASTLSVREVLANYSHIELTDEEEAAALLVAKQKKEAIIKYQAEQLRISESRKNLSQTVWDYTVTKNFMLSRSEKIFEGKFNLDESNSLIFEMLCRYFSEDKEFVSIAQSLEVYNPSLEKGILLAGDFGTGKTWMMKLFQRNKKTCFILRNAKEIAAQFQVDGQEVTETYIAKTKNAVNDATYFYQPYCGLCIDDMGTEEVKNNYGNKSNVISDVLEMRYAAGNTGIYLHATTNMNAEGIKQFYGGRIVSRMREIFNIIELKGNDRRK